MHNRAVAGASEVRCHLLGPLIWRVQCMRPAHSVVVVCLHTAQLIQPLGEKLGGFQLRKARKWGHLVVTALERALGRRAVVADDQVDERVIQDI